MRLRTMLALAPLVTLALGGAAAPSAGTVAHVSHDQSSTTVLQGILSRTEFSTPAPAGFDSLAASNAQLEKYGLPLRPNPQGSPQPAWWVNAIENAKTPVQPQFEPLTTSDPPPPSSSIAVATPSDQSAAKTSINWAGNIAINEDDYHAVNMTWTVPNVTGPSSGNAVSGIWDGLGAGYSTSGELMQAGTEQDVEGGTPDYYVWWEIYPEYSQVRTNLSVEPGDVMYVNVQYNLSKNQASFYIENETSGQYLPRFYETISGGTGGHKQAEWIAERTKVGSDYPPLAKWSPNPITLSGDTATDSSITKDVASWPHNEVTMVDPSNSSQTDAWPGPINSSGNAFPVHWSNFGS